MYHTTYDNAHWFEQFADPEFHRTVAGEHNVNVRDVNSCNMPNTLEVRWVR